MIKKLLKIVSVLFVITLIIAGVFFYSIFVSVERLNVTYETIKSDKIPVSLHDVKVAFISDLEYNHFMDKERLTNMIQTINETKPDVLIFGGDMFYSPLTKSLDDAIKLEVAQLLKTIEAPLGKFAVLGEQDHADEATLALVKDILYDSNFEIIDNTTIQIRNGLQEYVNLVGLDSLVSGSIDMSKAFADVNTNTFTILATHCPDTILQSELPKTSIDLMFAGHSHSAQIYLPFIGSLSSEPGAQMYNHGKHIVNNITLHVSNGLGTTNLDMRLFSPPQMLVYRLQSGTLPQPEPEVTPEPESTPETPVEAPSEDIPADEPMEQPPVDPPVEEPTQDVPVDEPSTNEAV